VEKMVADVDLDSNGEISFDEFCTMMDSRWSDVGKGGKRIEMKRLGCLTVLSV
jgi:Ca2+-binding EF-hand superfamily protein